MSVLIENIFLKSTSGHQLNSWPEDHSP